MKTKNLLYNGKPFLLPTDFEKAFKPSKWSIRAYMKFLKSLKWEYQGKFVDHTIRILSYNYQDKNTHSFIRAVQEKSRGIKVIPNGSSVQEPARTVIRLANGKESANALIGRFAQLKVNGMIESNWQEIASLLHVNFNMPYSYSTILSKLHHFKGDY